MSKKTIFMGGAALLLITFLALIGCNGAGTPIPPKPAFSVTGVAVGTNTLTVTLSDTLGKIDTAMNKTDYTIDPANYTVSKASGSGEAPQTVAKASKGTDKTVDLEITDIQKGLVDGDTIKVTLTKVGSKTYTATAPKPVGDAVATTADISITFSDDITVDGTPATSQFTVTGPTGTGFTVTAASVSKTNAKMFVLEGTWAAGITKASTSITIKYTPDAANRITSTDGIGVATFTQNVDVSKLP
jgi:hypothetical protein